MSADADEMTARALAAEKKNALLTAHALAMKAALDAARETITEQAQELDRLRAAAARVVAADNAGAGTWASEGEERMREMVAALDDLAAALADSASQPEGERITHGRHCVCSACAREDWASGQFICGMHGRDCPHVYAPLGEPREDVPWLLAELETAEARLREYDAWATRNSEGYSQAATVADASGTEGGTG